MPEVIKSKTFLRIHKTDGRIYSQEMEGKNLNVICESWINGVYLISVSNNEAKATFKLIKN